MDAEEAGPSWWRRTRNRLSSNLTTANWWQEAGGAMGDLGTFVPIVVALTLVNGLDLGTSLIATGIYNVITGVLFGVPMPVQPMKSIAAVAITEKDPLSIPQILAAGMSVSGITLLLGATGLIRLVAWAVPLPVVRGIQLAQGLSFAVKAVKYVLKQQNLSRDKSLGPRPWLGLDGLLLALIAFAFIVLVNGADASSNSSSSADRQQPADEERGGQPSEEAKGSSSTSGHVWWKRIERSFPTAMAIFLLGIVLAFVRRPSIAKHLVVGPSTPHLAHISLHDWKQGFLRAAVPQLPLTILNSVVAVCKLSADLFPEKKLVSPTRVSVSVGLMNLVGCWFGALPVCHGAGGLAGQYKFGATSGLSVTMLGGAKLLLGLLLGSSLVRILAEFPVGLLGVLLFFSGVELAMACRDQTSRLDSFVMLTCVAVSQASNLALACVFTVLLFFLLKLRHVNYRALWAWVRNRGAPADSTTAMLA